MTKVFYDGEFIERGPDFPITLVSIGLTRDDGAEYYAVNAGIDTGLIRDHEWPGMRDHVWSQLPHLGDPADYVLDTGHPDVKPRAQIAEEVAAFVLGVPDPELWASYGAYDHVVLCQLFGTMARLPKGFPMFTRDIKDFSLRVGDPVWPEQREPGHHALHDARHACEVWWFLVAHELNSRFLIRRPLARWRLRRVCTHPRAYQDAWMVDTGMGKIFRCRLCGMHRAV